jgi:Mg2+ and Co2+ transporter CorA
MELDVAQLSSLSSAIGELTDRITALANEYQGSPREDVAADLYEVERNLQTASRRLAALLNKIG